MPAVPNPRIPLQELKESKEYLLKYAEGAWQVETEEIEEHERLWFDYALQQGEFAPGANTEL
jgi:hypothetical protein